MLSRNEFNGGNFSYYDRKACSFKEFVDSSLLDLNFIDPSFTWCNNQNGSGRRWARLGRCLVNMDWINAFKFYKLQHLSRTFIDHSLLLLGISLHSYHSHNSFCFDNFWLDYLGCHIAVREAWEFSPHGNPM